MRWVLLVLVSALLSSTLQAAALPGVDAPLEVPLPPSDPREALLVAAALSGLDHADVQAHARPGPASADLGGAYANLLQAVEAGAATLPGEWAALDPALQHALAALMDAVADAAVLVTGMEDALTDADRATLRSLHDAYLDSRRAESRQPLVDAGADLGLPSAVDRARLAGAALRLLAAGLAAGPTLRDLAQVTALGPACLVDPVGLVALCGPEDNTIDGNHVLRVDLGGNDKHLGNSGGSGLPLLFPGPNGLPVALALDVLGNDQYSGTSQVQGSGSTSPGVLIDLEGSDTYVASDGFFTFAQGAGHLGGVGILHDALGNDVYIGPGWDVQGFGILGGIGLFHDPVGSDVYIGGTFAQGVGDFDAVGLFIDVEGADFFASGRWSMGFGDGMGLGIHWDGIGDDYRSAGSRSQGAGVGGYGILLDAQGNDAYIGAESQGYAVGGPVLRPIENVFEILGVSMVGTAILVDGSGTDYYSGAGCDLCVWVGGESGVGYDTV